MADNRQLLDDIGIGTDFAEPPPKPDEPTKTPFDLTPVINGLLQRTNEQSLETSTDPLGVLNSKLTKKQIASDILGGFLAGMGGRTFKTTRERLVEQELQKQELKIKREQMNISRLTAISSVAHQLREEKTEAQKLREKWNAEDESLDRAIDNGILSPDARRWQQAARHGVKLNEEIPVETQRYLAMSPERRNEINELDHKLAKAKLRGQELSNNKYVKELEDRYGSGDVGNIARIMEIERGHPLNSDELIKLARRVAQAKHFAEGKVPPISNINPNTPLGPTAVDVYHQFASRIPASNHQALAEALEAKANQGPASLFNFAVERAIDMEEGDAKKFAQSRRQALNSLDAMEDLLDQLEVLGAQTGKIEGTLEKTAERLIGDSNNKDLIIAAQQFQMNLIDYTKAQSGVTARPDELALYQTVWPDITKTPQLNREQVKGLRQRWEREWNFWLENTLGPGVYKTLVKPRVNIQE